MSQEGSTPGEKGGKQPPEASEGNAAPKKQSQAIVLTKDFVALITSRRMLPILKSTLAYIIALVLICLRKFDDLTPFPVALASMLITAIVGNVGGTIGATFQSTALALAGVGIGGLGFYILANIKSHVGQGFVLFVFVYIAALVKAQGLKWFGLSLFAVLVAFNGIYTSILVGGFNRDYLISYLEAYAWGGAIVLGVNLLVWPTTAEKELRRTLVLSLEHIVTLGHLLAKTYTLTLTDEEREVQDHLAQSLRADFAFLAQKIQDTAVEVNWSKYSMNDYSEFVFRTRALQLAAISAHSSLVAVEDRDIDLFKKYFLPGTKKPFLIFRRCVEVTTKEIAAALQCKPLDDAKWEPSYKQYLDWKEKRGASKENIFQDTPGGEEDQGALTEELQDVARDLDRQLRIVSQRLEREVEHSDDERTAASSSATPVTPSQPKPHDVFGGLECGKGPEGKCSCGVDKMIPTFDKFALMQNNILTEILALGVLHGQDQKLRMHVPQPSIKTLWGIGGRHDFQHSGAQTPKTTAPSVMDELLGPDEYDDIAERLADDEETAKNHHSILRVYSFLFAMRIYVEHLEAYHQAAVKFRADSKKPPPRRLQVHFFQNLKNPKTKTGAYETQPKTDRKSNATATGSETPVSPTSPEKPGQEAEVCFQEAMALLEDREYVKEKVTIWQRYKKIEAAIRSPLSIFAFKTAAGATVFAMLLFAESTRQFFINYQLTAGVLTLIVSISPTLGQTLATFVLQVGGSGIGYLWGVALLEMFRGVGGYTFNPYGMIALLALSSMPGFYLIYYNPIFFVFSLLALNSAGVVVCTEWIYVEYYRRPFDSPILRAGKSVTALGIALGIAIIFQVFILRNPARRTVRKALAQLCFSTLSYYTLFNAYAKVIIPYSVDQPRVPQKAIRRVYKELQKREVQIQQDIINLTPLLAFAAAERDFGPPFRADLAGKIIQSIQVMLDRVKEARNVMGTERCPEIITREFSQRLSPYRRRNIKLSKMSIHTCASSLASKAPLPAETPARIYLQDSITDNIHDALLISSHLSRTAEGRESILNGELTRYFAYFMTITSISDQMLNLEDACYALFGDIDSKLE